MKKSVLYLLFLAMLPMLVSCFSTMPSSSYVDELYGRMPSNSSSNGYYSDSSQSSQQYSSSATQYAESAVEEYYPGMIEESLTGALSYEDDSNSNASSYTTYSEPESSTTLVINVDAWSPAWYGAAWALSPVWRPSWYYSSWMNPYWGSSWYSPYWYSSWYSPYWGPNFGWYSWWGPSRPYYSHHHYSPYNHRPKYNRHNSVYGGGRNPSMAGSSHRSNSYLKAPTATRSASTATRGGTIERNINQYNTRGGGSTATRSQGTSSSSGTSYSNPVRNSGSNNSGVTRSNSGNSNSGSSYNRGSSSTRSSGTTRSGGGSGATRSSGSSGRSAGGIRNR